MVRVKRGVTASHRHKSLLKKTKGYRHGRKNLVKLAKQALLKASTFSYRDRRVKKREFRRLFIVRINGGLKPYGMRYSQFIAGLKLANIDLNRKTLSEMVAKNPEEFKKIVEQVQAKLASN